MLKVDFTVHPIFGLNFLIFTKYIQELSLSVFHASLYDKNKTSCFD